MADSNKKIQQVNIIDQGRQVHSGVRLAPNSEDIIVKPTIANIENKATLQKFLFAKFNDNAIDENNQPLGYRIGDGQYQVDPSLQSIWQWLTDHEDIVKKRLVGLYGQDGKYKNCDFLLANEKNDDTDIQAQYTLMESEVSSDKQAANIQAILEMFPELQLRDNVQDCHVPDNPTYDTDGNIIWNTDDEWTPEEKAQELMFAFGDKSFWQAFIERELENKKKLIGIYDNEGNCIGYFEPTRYNLDAIKDVYGGNGFAVEITRADGKTEQTIYRGPIETDEEALELMVNTNKKSVYQQLLELKDFWITLPFEVYDDNNGNTTEGINIANKCDIGTLHFTD